MAPLASGGGTGVGAFGPAVFSAPGGPAPLGRGGLCGACTLLSMIGGAVNPHAQSTVDYLTALARQVEANQKSKKGKRAAAVSLYKKQPEGATPSTHRTPVSATEWGVPDSRRRDQVEPTGETPTQPNTRSKSEEK